MSDRNGFVVVSGCPRSGTSVCMDINREVHGEDNILGRKFPQEARKQAVLDQIVRENYDSEQLFLADQYIATKQFELEEAQMPDDDKKYRDMNPDGFWECHYSVAGIRYLPQYEKILQESLEGKHRIVKVVSQGLGMSNPLYIQKIVFMLRHPRAVAKSQERLTRGFNYVGDDGVVRNSFENMVVHTPEMFIGVSMQAAGFFLAHPEIPVRIFQFEDLIEDPRPVIDDMAKFVGFGDYSKGYDVVKPKLDRSKHEDVHSALWDDAEFVYEMLLEADDCLRAEDQDGAHAAFEKILTGMSDPRLPYNREKRKWRCYRAKHIVDDAQCKLCYAKGRTMKSFKENSEKTPGAVAQHWSEEPCLYECGFNVDQDPSEALTIEESIKNNFWKD